ncbi:hypothetical protein [Nocardioides terrisoli]|uniref:hypothetical protein n=1 Tax=Nocardioides terrisoli TaxID=3388267 RepID=UPI00287BC46E|nr:hypothetical protein [Nocardioides marmorisolisilvae]
MRASSGPVTEPSLGPTSGSVSGWLGECIVVIVIIMAVTGGGGLPMARVVIGALLVAVLIWAFLLRSRVVLRDDGILLRNVFSDTSVPYGLVDRVTVRSVTHVFVGERRYVGVGVGRSRRAMTRQTPTRGTEPDTPRTRLAGSDLPDFLEQQVAVRLKDATPGEGVVRRRWAWPEIAVTGVLAVVFVVTLLL